MQQLWQKRKNPMKTATSVRVMVVIYVAAITVEFNGSFFNLIHSSRFDGYVIFTILVLILSAEFSLIKDSPFECIACDLYENTEIPLTVLKSSLLVG